MILKHIYDGLLNIYQNKKYLIKELDNINTTENITMLYILTESENRYVILNEYDYYCYKLIRNIDDNYETSKIIEYFDEKLMNILMES
jgi:hypothetical protein